MKLKYKLGFTLIELLLAMGIIAFLATASVAILGNFNKKQSIKIAHDDVKNALAQAKSYALSQVKSINCNVVIDEEDIAAGITIPDRLIGYEVKFDLVTDPEKHSYAIYEVCLNPAGIVKEYDSAGEIIPPVSTYYLPKDIFFKSNPGRIGFNVLKGGTTFTSTKTITIVSEDGTQTTSIEVTPGGVIKDVAP